MANDAATVRLELLKILVPLASRVGLLAGETITKAHEFEQYVLNGKEEPKPEVSEPEKPVAKQRKPRQNTRRKTGS